MEPSARTLSVTAKATRADLLSTVMRLGQRSRFSIVLGFAMLTMGIIGIVLGAALDFGIVYLFGFGLVLLTGTFAVPFQLWAISRRPDLTLGPITIQADDDGISVANAQIESKQSWPFFRGRHELPGALVLQSGVTSMVIPKRGFSDADLAALRGLIERHGGFTPLMTPSRYLLWGALGVVLGFGPLVVSYLGAAT